MPGRDKPFRRARIHPWHDPWGAVPDTVSYTHLLLDGKYASAAELDAIEKKVDEEIEEAIEFAQESPWPDVSILTEDVYV